MKQKYSPSGSLLAVLLAVCISPVYADEPQRQDKKVLANERLVERSEIYEETDSAIHQGTRRDENCFYSEEHEHLHCYTGEISPVVRLIEIRDDRSYNLYKTRRYGNRFYDKQGYTPRQNARRYKPQQYETRLRVDYYNPMIPGHATGLGLEPSIIVYHSYRNSRYGPRHKHRRHRD